MSCKKSGLLSAINCSNACESKIKDFFTANSISNSKICSNCFLSISEFSW